MIIDLKEHLEHCKKELKRVEIDLKNVGKNYDDLMIEYWKWEGIIHYLDNIEDRKYYSKLPSEEIIDDNIDIVIDSRIYGWTMMKIQVYYEFIMSSPLPEESHFLSHFPNL